MYPERTVRYDARTFQGSVDCVRIYGQMRDGMCLKNVSRSAVLVGIYLGSLIGERERWTASKRKYNLSLITCNTSRISATNHAVLLHHSPSFISW